MTLEHEEYELGRDVTDSAVAKSRRQESVVLSVRISTEDLRRLEEMAKGSGRTVSQIVKEAIRQYELPSPTGVRSQAIATFMVSGGYFSVVSGVGGTSIAPAKQSGFPEPFRTTVEVP